MLRFIAVFIHHFSFNDVEYLFGVHVAAVRAFAFRKIHLVCQSFEVDDAFNGIAVINRVATIVQDKQLIEHLEDVARRLVDYGKDQFSAQG